MYQKFCEYYDEIMEDMSYTEWLNIVKQYLSAPSSILDLGCGTGTLPLLLSQEGYQISGLYYSLDMLAIAKQKAQMNRQTIVFYQEDITTMNLNQKFQGITCFFDTLNHLDHIEKVKQAISNAYDHLEEDGYFFFDLFTKYKLETVSEEDSYQEFDFFSYEWNIKTSENAITHTIIFEEDGIKTKETYQEYYYEYQDVIDPRFKLIHIYGDFQTQLFDTTESYLVVLQK